MNWRLADVATTGAFRMSLVRCTPTRVELNKKFTDILDSCPYCYLLEWVFPFQLVTQINPDQVGANQLAFQDFMVAFWLILVGRRPLLS